MSKAGSSRLRKALFFPAMSAMRYIPLCRTFGQRLKEKGKKSIVVIGAIMTKLLHLIFGILRTGQPFIRSTSKARKSPNNLLFPSP